MAYFVNQSGELFDADPKDARDLAAQGLRPASPDDITKHNENVAYEEKSVAGKVGDIATTGLQGAARGAMAPGLALQHALTGSMPGVEAGRDQSALSESVFGPEAQARKERSPLLAGAAESAPMLLGGAAAGGLASVPALVGLGGESAALGLSQESVDAVTQKRDFSVQAAGMNGIVNLAFGAVGMAAAGGLGRLARRGAAGAGEAAAAGGAAAAGAGAEGAVAGAEGGAAGGAAAAGAEGAAPPPRVKRNWLGQIDKGEVPSEPASGTRQAKSAGAAGSNFDASTAAQSIDEIKTGKVKPGAIAEAAPKMREHLASEAAHSLDTIDTVLHDDASLATKQADFAPGAESWTPEQVAAQDNFVTDMRASAEKLASEVAETPHAGGIGIAARDEIAKGLSRVAEAGDGAARNVAVDNYKRGLDRLVNRITSAGNSAIDQETRSGLARAILAHSDEVRAGLENPDYFGANAALQKAENAAHKELIEPLMRVQRKLYEVTGKTFGEMGVGSVERRADPSVLRRLFEDPHMGGELFQRDLRDALEGAESRAAAREAHGLSKLDRLPLLKQALQDIRDDFNTATVLQFAEERAGGGGHGAAGASAGANIAASVATHGVEAATLSQGFASGRILRPMQGQLARSIDAQARRLLRLPEAEMAAPGTATRELLDRYAQRVRNASPLEDAAHQASLPGPLRTLLKRAGAPIAAGGAAAAGAALAGEGQANAAEPADALPADKQSREAVDAQLRALSPDERAVHARTAEAFARIAQQTDARVRGAVDELFRTATDPNAKARSASPKARALDARAAELGVPRAVARFMGRKTDDPVEAWQDKSKLLTSIMSDPSVLARHMAENLGDLPKLQPEMYTSLVAQTMSIAGYLHDKLPQPSGKSLLDPEGYPPTLEEITEFAGHWTGALHSLDTLDDLAANDLLPEQMEAVQANWPDLYGRFQSSALSHLHELGQSGKRVPIDAMAQLDTALGLNGAGEPLLSPDMALLIAQATAKAASNPAAASGSSGSAPSDSAPGRPVPIQSKEPERLASASLATLKPEAGA